MDYLYIDGGHGEGGGQIVRTAICLSCITGKPIHLGNIRRNRNNSGLKAQHVAAISVLQEISSGTVDGGVIGSSQLKFIPGKVKSMNITKNIDTAASIPLVLQVLIDTVAITGNELKLSISGGTDVAWSPTINYTNHVLRKAYLRMGIEFSLKVNRRGYYPKGGGLVDLHVIPSQIKAGSFSKRNTKHVKMICTFSKIPKENISSEINMINAKLAKYGCIVDSQIESQVAADSGASLLLYSEDEHSIIGTDTLYDKKRQCFDLDYSKFLDDAGVDENLADMIVVPASVCCKKTVFYVRKITEHLQTNLFVASKITGCKYGIGKISGGFEVIIEGVSYSSIK